MNSSPMKTNQAAKRPDSFLNQAQDRETLHLKKDNCLLSSFHRELAFCAHIDLAQ